MMSSMLPAGKIQADRASGHCVLLARRIAPLLALAVLLAGCGQVTKSAAPAAPAITAFKPATPDSVHLQRTQLIGWWYGDQPSTEGGRVQWIMRRSADGTFSVSFRNTHSGGAVKEQTEFGEWGVNANLIITLTKGWLDRGIVEEAPGGDSYYWDVYTVAALDSDQLDYISVETKNHYHAKKVPVGFEFPP